MLKQILTSALLIAIPFSANSTEMFFDLGGKSVQIAGEKTSLTGVRGGVVLPSNLKFGLAAFALNPEKQDTQASAAQSRQHSYSFAGLHLEYPWRFTSRLHLNAALLTGVGFGEHQQSNGPLEETSYLSIEPGISLSAKLYDQFWLNAGASYFVVDDNQTFENGTSVGLYGRYLW